MDKAAIASRVRTALTDSLGHAQSDRSVAARVGMTPDAFSRAVNGERAFSSLELARLADLVQADLHYLITGRPDPYRVVFAARHDYDAQTGSRQVPGEAGDAATLEAVKLAYTQAQMWLERAPGQVSERADHPEEVDLPSDPAALRSLLGPDFVRVFAERTEEALAIDVLRIQNLSTDYSFSLGSQRVVLLRAQGNWFRANFSLAHELGHLALRHHDANHRVPVVEAAANQFASELLLPEDQVRAINWQEIDESQLARKVWDWGVSGQTLAIRLSALQLSVSSAVSAALQQPTQRLLRHHLEVVPEPQALAVTSGTITFATLDDPITTRMRNASERRIPNRLIRAHLDGIADGFITKGSLAWLLETSPDELSVDEPMPVPAPDVDDLAAAFGLAIG